MASKIVIGHGQAGTWRVDASDVTREDVDLLHAARAGNLYEKGQWAGACDRDGRLLGEGWLCVVVDSDGLEENLDADPAVIAYCDHNIPTRMKRKRGAIPPGRPQAKRRHSY